MLRDEGHRWKWPMLVRFCLREVSNVAVPPFPVVFRDVSKDDRDSTLWIVLVKCFSDTEMSLKVVREGICV